MKSIKLLVMCFGLCFLFGCKAGEESDKKITPTVTPIKQPETLSPTATLIPTVIPIPTDIPRIVMIPIDVAHFGSAVFCEFIAKEYDSDSDGYLNEAERYAVTDITIPGRYDADYSEECLDGFEYFPNLEILAIDTNTVKKVIIRNHPTLKRFGGTEGYIKELEIMGCKELESIGFYTYTLGSVLIAEVSSETKFSLGNNVAIESMALDEKLQIYKTDARDGNQVLFRTLEDGTMVYEYIEQTDTIPNGYERRQIPVTILRDETGASD